MVSSCSKPLNGVRIIDFSRILAGPFATMVLGDLGAEVIKVEPPKGDDTRTWAPYLDGESVYFMSTNRNKRSIVVNLKKPEGREIIYRLVKNSDVVIENFREGVAKRLGIDYDTIRSIKDDIVYCSIRGFGFSEAYKDKGGADIVIQAMSGLMDATGTEEGEPVRVAFALFDIFAGMIAATSIASALYNRKTTGKGSVIEVSLYDAALFSMSYIPLIYLMTGKKPRKMGSAHPSLAPYQAFRCRDGKYLVVGAFNDAMWMNICRALELTELIDDPRFRTNKDRVKNRDILIPLLEERFMERDCREWVEILDRHGVTVGPVYSIDEVFKDPYVVDANIVVDVPHPILGMIKQILYPALICGERLEPTRHPPLIGEHTLEILVELGYTDDEIKQLVDKDVVYGRGLS